MSVHTYSIAVVFGVDYTLVNCIQIIVGEQGYIELLVLSYFTVGY